MASVTVGPCGSSPQIYWTISWTPGNTSWTVTAQRGTDGTFSGGGWTVALLLDNGTTSSVYVPAPIGANTSSSKIITMSPLPSSANYIYLQVTSTTFSSSGIYYGNTGGIYQPPVYYTVTVEDRVNNSSGALLGSGGYNVLSGTNISASELRNTTYSGYNYVSCTSTTITGATTLYRYFTPIGWHISDTATYASAYGTITRNVTLGEYCVSRIALTFAMPGDATFQADSTGDTFGILSLCDQLDSGSGWPTPAEDVLLSDDDSGGNSQFKFTYNVQTGVTYYLWVRFYGASASGQVSINITAPCWFIENTDTISSIKSKYNKSCSLSSYGMSRIAITFADSGKAKFYTTSSVNTVGYLSDTPGFDVFSGRPVDYLVFNDDYDGSNQYTLEYEVEAGKTYYLWTRFYSYIHHGDVNVVIIPPNKGGLKILIEQDGTKTYGQFTIWIYKGDGGGPNNNGWHRSAPMIYCNANGEERFHYCG